MKHARTIDAIYIYRFYEYMHIIFQYAAYFNSCLIDVTFMFSGLSFGASASDVLDFLQFVNKTSADFTYITGTHPSIRAISLQGKSTCSVLHVLHTRSIIGRCGGDEKTRMTTLNRQKSNAKKQKITTTQYTIISKITTTTVTL